MNRNILYNGTVIEFTDKGKGKTIVLLHGYLETKEVWEPLSEKLAERFRVIAIDLPGHGGSAVADETHTMEFLADSVKHVLDETGAGKVLLAGHSLGGYVTLAFVDMFPGRLSGYVLFHSHPNADPEEAVKKRNREISVVRAGKKNIMYPANISMMFARHNLSGMKDAVKRSTYLASFNPAEGIIAMLKGMIVRPSRISVIEKGEVPLLWILGRWDLYFSPEKATKNVKLPGNAKIVILENSGHLGFIEETEHSLKLMSDFAGEIKW